MAKKWDFRILATRAGLGKMADHKIFFVNLTKKELKEQMEYLASFGYSVTAVRI